MFDEEDIIFSYTTKMAVEDGVMIPIPGIISGTPGIESMNPDGSITASLKSVITAEDIDKPSPAIFFMLYRED